MELGEMLYIGFRDRNETLESIFGSEPLTHSQMQEKLWSFIVENGLLRETFAGKLLTLDQMSELSAFVHERRLDEKLMSGEMTREDVLKAFRMHKTGLTLVKRNP